VVSRSDDVVDGVKQMILDGRLQAGDRPPAEKELAATLGVSRGSLREGVHTLGTLGILESRHGDGTYVTTLDPALLLAPVAFVAELQDDASAFHAVRRLLETEAAGLAALHIDDAALARLRAALDEAGLGPWLRALPHGLDTLLGAGARGMSAGEEQQLALARVFLRDPGLVLMDEPTARLDPYSERLLVPALERLLEDRTAVVVEHRPHLLLNADRILVLGDDGKVAEEGERAVLAADPSSRLHTFLRTAEAAR